MRTAQVALDRSRGVEEEMETREGLLGIQHIMEVIDTERGECVTVLDVSGKCDWTDTMVIVSGRSKKQLFAIVDGVRRMAKGFVATDPSLPASLTIEGAQSDDWMLLDLGKVVIHAMTPSARAQYDIEGLWNAIADSSEVVETDEDDSSISTANIASLSQEELSELKEKDEDRRLLMMVERAWGDRPVSQIKTKQTEAQDMLDEEDVIAMMNSDRVVRASKPSKKKRAQ
ncbi:hypothetical protein HDU76_012090 [Blyttiomyces sp. JEL0837]|nr:hypothetical protein HDU76_012090 [Blyttiomyces sp. JEL0837]